MQYIKNKGGSRNPLHIFFTTIFSCAGTSSVLEFSIGEMRPVFPIENYYLYIGNCHTPIFDPRSYIHTPSDPKYSLTFQKKSAERYFKIPHFCFDSGPLLILFLLLVFFYFHLLVFIYFFSFSFILSLFNIFILFIYLFIYPFSFFY